MSLTFLFFFSFREKLRKAYHSLASNVLFYEGSFLYLLLLIHFLNEILVCRNLPAFVRDVPPDVSSQDGLEIKVCVRTYRLFYVSYTEDFMWKYRSKEEMEKNSHSLSKRNALRRKWLMAVNNSDS